MTPLISTPHRSRIARHALRACIAAVTVAFIGSAQAHHGTSQYDMQTEWVLKGTVTEWRFSNPHAWLYLRTVDDRGQTAAWTIESAPLGWLERNGWTATTLVVGEQVTVKLSPARGVERVGIMREVTRENGETRVIRRPWVNPGP